MMVEALIGVFLIGALAVTSLVVIKARDLFAAVMLFSIYSLISASLFLVMDAADVAFTEAAVGAGVSTVLMLATLAHTGREQKPTANRASSRLALLLVTVMGASLVYGIVDLPPLGEATNPANVHVAPYYLDRTDDEIGVPNVVTAVLASYRGFDTLGEVFVIFTAGMAVLMLIGGHLGRKRKGDQDA